MKYLFPVKVQLSLAMFCLKRIEIYLKHELIQSGNKMAEGIIKLIAASKSLELSEAES